MPMTRPGKALSARAMRDVLEIVDPAAHTGDGEQVPWTMLQALAAVVGCDDATFLVMDVRNRRTAQQAYVGAESPDSVAGTPRPQIPAPGPEVTWDDDPDGEALFWSGFWECIACCYPQRTGDFSTVTRLSDFYTRREFARTKMGAFAALTGFRHEIMLPLPPDGDLDRRVLLFRAGGPDFTDRDVLLLTLLRPHVYALHQRQRRRRRGWPDLTPRQLEILRLVAVGCSNAQIARALLLSEATVGKHLENIYARLEVTNRTAAAATLATLEPCARASVLEWS